MLPRDFLIMMVVGGLFIAIGIVLLILGTKAKKSYDVSPGMDVREYMESDAEPKTESLAVGGWIIIAIGILLLAMAGAFMLWG